MKRTKKQCNKCKEEFSLSNFNKHYKSCKGKIIDDKLLWKQNNELYKCPYCKKEYKGIKFHIWSSHTEKENNWHPNKGNPSKLRGRKIGSKTFEIRQKISKNNKGAEFGGNKTIKWYNIIHPNGSTIKLRGTWELRFSKILNKLDSSWIKPNASNGLRLKWIDENLEEHFYIPDFYSPGLNKFFEIKGYYSDKNKIKMKYILSHYNNVEIIFLKDLKQYEDFYL
jgi:hypothetical protein